MPPPREGLLTTIAWGLGGKATYALEAAVFVTGAAVQWLRDGLRFLTTAGESDAIARSVPDNGGVYFVPALSGLGTPYWDAAARGLFIGLTRGSERAHLVRAVLESIAYQARELADLMDRALASRGAELRADGGASGNAFLMSFLASLIGRPVRRAETSELTAAGAAGIAGISAGLWSRSDFAALLPAGRTFSPLGPPPEAEFARWKDAVSRSLRWA